MYELHNLSALKCFIEDTLEPGEAYMCTLNGDFLSPSLLSSLDLGAAAVAAMNAIPVTHACLGNHEFDHSIETLGQRLAELDCDVINTNVFACPLGEESGSAAAAAAALASPLGVPHPETSHQQPFAHDGDPSAGAFLDHLPRTATVTLGGVTVGLLGLCTTSTPLSSARRPRGVVFAECVPLARRAARTLLPTVDAVVALTHQTLPEDARLAEEVPEIAAILGGHEHTPFAGRMGHGANAAAVLASKGVEATTSECVHPEAGTLCVKAGMDAENVVVVTIEVPGGPGGSVEGHPRPPSATLGKDAGGECDAEAAASALAAAETAAAEAAVARAARAHHDEFGHGGLWPTARLDADAEREEDEVTDDSPSEGESSREGEEDASCDDGDDECSTSAANNVVPHPTIVRPGPAREPASDDRARENDLDDAGVVIAPGAELGSEVSVRRPGSGVVVAARMFSLRGYRTDPDMDADVWRRSEVLRDLNQYTLSLHEHGERLGLAPLTSRDARVGQCSLGTLFATILRDECRADVCLYNSGGIRGNASYGSEPLTYGDLVAEVPFENNIITLEMTGDEVRDAIAFSEAEQIRKSREGGSWGGYLQWDEGVAVRRRRRGARDDVDSNADANANAGADVGFEWNVETIRGRAFEPGRVYRVVTWAGLLDGADDIPVLRDIGRRIAANLRAESDRDGEEHEAGAEAAAPAICGSDGIPFKILVMRHLARRRWSEILSGASFDDLDTNGDGKLQTEEVAAALRSRTASASPQQEAEAMVRSFDADGDGALTAEDVSEIVEHFGGEDERDTWRRAAARRSVGAAVEATATSAGAARFLGRRVAAKAKARGEEVQARVRKEDDA